MAKNKVSYAELTHQVVRESPDPLPFDDILRRVQAITPITTKNPKATIRSAIGQSRSIVALGDGRYGWKPRVITGSVLRLTLSESDLAGQHIELGDEMRDALWPLFFEIQLRTDHSPANVQLPDGCLTRWPLDFLGPSRWGTTGAPEFWTWFRALGAAPGDHLIVRVLDGLARLYGVEFQPRAARDEAAIAQRNQAILQATLAFNRTKYNNAMTWDITTHLLVTGQYKHPVPPDPFSEIWTEDVWPPETKRTHQLMSQIFNKAREERDEEDEWDDEGEWDDEDEWDEEDDWEYEWDEDWDDDVPLFKRQDLLVGAVQGYDPSNPPGLPREYQRGAKRRPRPSRKAQQGKAGVWTLRVSHRAQPETWRDVEIAEDQTLEDLHLIIQNAFGWNDDHLYSFFMSGRPLDARTEIGSPWSETGRHTHQVEIGQLDLKPGGKFLYYFDYGDRHEFDVLVLHATPSAPPAPYPRVVAQHGQALPQYPTRSK